MSKGFGDIDLFDIILYFNSLFNIFPRNYVNI
jgi:hypothetical protein